LDWNTPKRQEKEKTNVDVSIKKKKKENPKITEHTSSKFSGNSINLNTATPEDFKSLGLEESLAHRIVAYRKKAGPFYHYRDLYDIYEMDSQWVQRLLPRIQIQSDQLHTLDINTANQKEWEKLPGIGPVYAGRIIKFREALGGFVNKNQLKEVYGLPEETWIRMKPRINLKSLGIKKIKVNSADIEDFARHPYIDWSLAKRLYRYKEQHYPISKLDDMHGLNPEIIKKILPYFDFNIEQKSTSHWAQLNPSDSI
jgi:competence ComEA-like helix-hairpin-helix protein